MMLYLDGDSRDNGNGEEGDDEDAKQLKESNVLTHAGSLVYLTELKCNEELS